MSKLRRSARLVHMTHYLLNHPQQVIALKTFGDKYQAAKSSISEDLTIIKEVFEQEGIGQLLTLAGATGGVRFIPSVAEREAKEWLMPLCDKLQDPMRILPGGYLYMSDLLANPHYVKQIGRLFSARFAQQEIDCVMTIETKGIPLAYATAEYLNVPVVIVRRDSKVTEGSAVSINYVSGSQKRIQTMWMARRAIREQQRILIIDDFMKAGSTIHGMIQLLHEFDARVAGVGVFVENYVDGERLVDDYISLARITSWNSKEGNLKVGLGNYFQ
ncbi:pur operon repressor [Rubeoparvulum massiliense]|uniref:pur operon repressor n=1 Tax=Rubeoparvulum massiliense TaxID=1631346 RepID=UPI00065E6EE4|nr:pur operon repressor [Rubeoparvulum massiliense]